MYSSTSSLARTEVQHTEGRLGVTLSDKVVQELIAAATQAQQHAYCPYSRFRVGAAVLADDGRIFAGCNVENASYGLTICAERNAVFQAVANGCLVIRAVVVVTSGDAVATPCGACRQVLSELGPEADVIVSTDTQIARWSMRELLPEPFGPHNVV